MKRNIGEDGFSYIDVMIAIVILLVGILAMLSALTANLMRSYESEKTVVAKQTAISTVESILSVQEIARAGVVEGWESVGNIGSNPVAGEMKGIFMNGWRPIREDAGWDGIAGTVDDACAANNPCVVAGRPNNESRVIDGYERRIIITDVPDPERPSPPNAVSRRKIEVSVRYRVNQAVRESTVSTIVADYKRYEIEDEDEDE